MYRYPIAPHELEGLGSPEEVPFSEGSALDVLYGERIVRSARHARSYDAAGRADATALESHLASHPPAFRRVRRNAIDSGPFDSNEK